MSGPRNCGDCPQEDHCTQFGPISAWNPADWDVTITATGDDPTSTASINWSGPDLEVTATVGTSGSGYITYRPVQVVLRHKTFVYRHYRHQKPFTLLTMRCELELAARPIMALGQGAAVLVRMVTAAGAPVGITGVPNLYNERRIRRDHQTLTPIVPPPCPPPYVDYFFEVVLTFSGSYCNRGEYWVTKLNDLEWRVGSDCESYVLPHPGNDALEGSFTWSGLSNGSGRTHGMNPPDCEPYDECLPCELTDPVTVYGSTAADTGVVGFSVGFVPWTNCSFISSDLANNGAPLFAAALAWDGDIGEWAIHHRGYHYMSGHTTRLTGGLSLTAAAFLWIIGGNLLVDPECGPDQWFCLETDICNNWPLTLSVALSAPP